MYTRKKYIIYFLTITAFLSACGTLPSEEVTAKKTDVAVLPFPPLPEKKPEELIAKLPLPEPLDIFSCDRDDRSIRIANKPYARYQTMSGKYRWGGKITAEGNIAVLPEMTMTETIPVIFVPQKVYADDKTTRQFLENQTKNTYGYESYVWIGAKTDIGLDTTAKISTALRRKIIEAVGNGTILKLTFYFAPNEYEMGLPGNFSEACKIEG